MNLQRVAVLAFDGISPFHLSVPCVVFGEQHQDLGMPAMAVQVCALTPGSLRTSMGLEIVVSAGLEALADADLVVVPSWANLDQPPAPELLAALCQAHRRGAILMGLCLGTFLLAQTGLLDGRSVTTHWAWAGHLARRFPALRVDPKVLYIDHGDILTSAGTAAGLDCCLHLLRRQLGAAVANRLARRLVIPPHRQGNQAQYVEQVLPDRPAAGRLGKTLDWALAHLDQPLDVDTLARHAAMSRRSLSRHFQRTTGCSVVEWLTAQRVALAQGLLESTQQSVEQVAACAGFGSALSLRQAFVRHLETTPGRYRREFQHGAGPTASAEA